MIYLYIKQHNITGLKYLGMTRKIPGSNEFNKYKGSGKHWKRHIKVHGNNVTTKILYYTPSEDDFKQVGLFFSKKWNIVESEEWANLMPESGEGSAEGLVTVKDEDGKNIRVSVDDPRFLSGELISIKKGQVSVRDSTNNHLSVGSDDPRFLSGEFVGASKGLVPVRDTNGKCFSVPLNDIRYTSGELNHISKGLVSVRDGNNDTLKVSVDDPRYLSGELVSVGVGYKHSEDAIRRMKKSLSGTNNYRFKGFYCHKDFGEYPTMTELSKVMRISQAWLSGVFNQDLNRTISKHMTTVNPYFNSLNYDPTGMTFSEVGFYFKHI